jgi:uncharacterized protein YndB with AHSA1/START domain
VTGGGESPRTLTLRRTFARGRADVFDAWTVPGALATWWGGSLARTLHAEIDLRVGGAYRLEMQSGARVFALEGVYRVVERPERLVYTWRWEGIGIDRGRQSLVTVEFHDESGATEVVVTHEGLEADESLTFHDAGWAASLDRLGAVLVPGEATVEGR